MDLEFRSATLDDWPGVLDISQGVYGGMDYLPSVYSSWVEEAGEERPTRFNFVVCLKKRIVGYVSLLFTRDGRKFLMSAERVARELQGRGIGARIVQFVAKFVRDKQAPGEATQQLLTFSDAWISEASLERKLAAEGRLLLTLTCPLFSLDLAQLKAWAKLQHSPAHLQPSTDLSGMMGCAWESLVPEHLLHVNWDPFSPSCEEELGQILCPRTRTVVRGPTSFSVFDKPVQAPACTRVGLDIFATDLQVFLQHLNYQLVLFSSEAVEGPLPHLLFVFTPVPWVEEILSHIKEEMPFAKKTTFGNQGRSVNRTFFCTKRHSSS